MKWRPYLELARPSNLPTIWTNSIAGAKLASNAPLETAAVLLVALGLSSAYVAGMFLNDAFDRRCDATARPNRPIPSGAVSAKAAFVLGFLLLGTSVVIAGVAAPPLAGNARAPALAAALGLVLAIVLYDVWHKKNPIAPVIMGLCRGSTYVVAALALSGEARASVLVGAFVLCAYVAGLTYAARRGKASERRIVIAIAGISLVDAGAIASTGALGLAWVGVTGFVATIFLQRWVRGT